jgi:hypothetical protein
MHVPPHWWFWAALSGSACGLGILAAERRSRWRQDPWRLVAEAAACACACASALGTLIVVDVLEYIWPSV